MNLILLMHQFQLTKLKYISALGAYQLAPPGEVVQGDLGTKSLLALELSLPCRQTSIIQFAMQLQYLKTCYWK